ncbi:M12 family metallopeptidase [Dyadobacter arcticus]|uniref:Peptidase M12A domain-containing protein n=1 Tax=Dyadobacter arcticus TaxID=1078754 RepID=A0ABX0ULX7_9BACT|nr:M12 family metallopeptidase [Dyadobacter arcticus]NIJ52974.1 hypothetical protein [Dyadobacter arcticus]
MKSISLPVWASGLILASSLFSSCEDKLGETTLEKQTAIVSSDSTGTVKDGQFSGHRIRYKEIDGQAVWQDDIILTAEQLAGGSDENARVSGAGYANKDYRWPDAFVPYEISANLSETNINAAITEWESKTSVTFVKRTNQADYIRFVSSSVNRSNIGMITGKQVIELESGASVGTIVHEIGHAIGLVHEQARADRDQYLTVHWENIEAGKEHNFEQYGSGVTFDGGKQLDFNSIMLYGPKYFSKNGKETLTKKDGTTWTKNETVLSVGDVNTITAMYSNLYIRWFKSIYSVSTKDGSYQLLNTPEVGATGAAKTIAEDNNYIWTIEGNGVLTKAHRLSGDVIQKYPFGTGAIGLTGEDQQGFMYAQQGTRLWKINKFNGTRTRLGGVNALENWTGTQALYYHNNGLYIIWKNTLYKINRTTGLVERQYGGNWTDVKGMAAPYGTSPFLYMMLADKLWRINKDTGAIDFVRDGFPNVTAMSGVGGNLFMVSGDNLYRVNEKGSRALLSQGWNGANSMGAIHHAAGLF